MKTAATAGRYKKRPLWLRAVGMVCVLLTAWHILASFLWIAPTSSLRDVAPGNTLKNYMLPMFGQSWSVFAPAPLNADYSLSVRAKLPGIEGEQTTEWVDAVNREMSLGHHTIFAPRAALAGNYLASDYRSTWNDLNDEQKQVVEWHYYRGEDWAVRFEESFEKRAQSQSTRDQGTARDFMDNEHRIRAYATQVARAVWGEDVIAVQFRVGRHPVIPFSQRNDADAVRPTPSHISSGWRGVVVREGQSDENFAEIFLSLDEVK